ncbi:hypothetical protein [Staphylococcus hominis]
MVEIKTSNLSFKQINAVKILDGELKRDPFLLINFNELVNDLISERDSFHKQRDELINDIAEIKRKAEILDKLEEMFETSANANRKHGFNGTAEVYERYLDIIRERGSDE